MRCLNCGTVDTVDGLRCLGCYKQKIRLAALVYAALFFLVVGIGFYISGALYDH
jgi:hypothetical protein